ncbi:ASCH domain-containing protein [Fodinibius saliphilus]|uniref:ASCH domain-containing protein n=1 Tax=Fodinibius saliphilus TaxID=1920650 RepID=UPI00110959A6|nr:ASCH domain-containing protein [Fodinibius saliphilus]
MNKTERKIKHLYFHENYYEKILEGNKISTVRKGVLIPDSLNITLIFNKINEKLDAKILRLDYTYTLNTLTEQVAKKDGFNSIQELKDALHKHYPNMNSEQHLTIIEFKVYKS